MHEIADSAHEVIKTQFGLGNAKVDSPIIDTLSWRPTFWWKKKADFIACEVTERPFLNSFKGLFAEIIQANINVKIIVASPDSVEISATDYQGDLKNLRKFGFGHVSISNTGAGDFNFIGPPLPQFITEPNYGLLRAAIKPPVREAYRIYMQDGNPIQGVQQLGQLVESIIYGLGDQACQSRKLPATGGYCAATGHYSVSTLINELNSRTVISNAILGRCRGFMDDRNACSHRPRNNRDALRIARRLKPCWDVGIGILQDIPGELRDKGFSLRIT